MICMTGLPVLPFSATTSSTCMSSSRPCSRSRLIKGSLVSAILCYRGRLCCFDFLEFCQNGRWILSFGDHFMLRNHARVVFFEQERVQRDHAVLGAGLNIGVNAEALIVANERADRRSVDHDFEN